MKVRSIVLFCVVIIVTGLYFLFSDVDQSPEITAIQQQYNIPSNLEKNAHIELISWQYGDNENSYQRAINDYNQVLTQLDNGSIRDVSPIQYPQLKPYKSDGEPYECSLAQSSCFDELITQRASLQQIVSKNKSRLNRLYQLAEFNNFETLNPLAVSGRFDFQSVYKIASIDILFKIENGEYEQAEHLIATLIQLDRKLMTSTDQLIFKILPIVNIDSIYIPLIERMNRQGFDQWTIIHTALQPLSFDEWSLNKIWHHHMYRDTKWLSFEEVARQQNDFPFLFRNLLSRFAYKQNMTLNKLAKFHSSLMVPNGTHKSSLTEIRSKIESVSSTIYERNQLYIDCQNCGILLNLNNIAGHLMELAALPRYVDIYPDIINVDLKLQLVRLLVLKNNLNLKNKLAEKQWQEPYLQTQPFIKDDMICYHVEEDVCVRH